MSPRLSLRKLIQLLIVCAMFGLTAPAWGDNFLKDEQAVRRGDAPKVEALLRHHRELAYTRNRNGWTLLHIAALAGRADMAKLLLNAGSDVNARTNATMTPLCLASSVEVAQELLVRGADVNASCRGLTPTDWALQHSHSDVADLLMQHSGLGSSGAQLSRVAVNPSAVTGQAPGPPPSPTGPAATFTAREANTPGSQQSGLTGSGPHAAVAGPPPLPAGSFESTGNKALLLTLYRQNGDTFAPFALAEVAGRIVFDAQGISSGVEALQRLQFAEPRDQWLEITQRSLEAGKAEISLADGKGYTVFNLGFKPLAGLIEPSAAPSAETTSPATPAIAAPLTAPNRPGAAASVDEAQAFDAATQADTAGAWESFLKRFPAGKRRGEARQALDSLLYGQAVLAGANVAALESLFRRCKTPDGADKVFALLDDATYQKAQLDNSSLTSRSYLARFPKGRHAAEARKTLDELAWSGCAQQKLEACRQYEKDYPEGAHAHEAGERISAIEYEQVKAENSIEGYEKFVENHGYGSARADAEARLRDLRFQKAEANGTLSDWQKYYDLYRFEARNDPHVASAGRETERLLYEAIVATPTLQECQDYEERFNDGAHVQQVRVAMEPLLFEAARHTNTVEAYKDFLDKYPQGTLGDQARSLLDPLLFASAFKKDWWSAYEEYLRYCPAGANAEKAQQRLAWLKANPAVPTVDFPAELLGPDFRWEWNTVFKESGKKCGYQVSGSGSIETVKGNRYVSSYGGSIDRGTITVPAGGSGKDNYWVSSNDGEFCDGHAVFDWTGEDAGGHAISLTVNVHLKCSKNPEAQ